VPAKRRHLDRSLELKDGKLRIVAVADTHSNPHPDSAARIARLEPDAILHAGDIGDLAVLDGLARIAPVLAVRGNIDVHARDLPDTLAIDVRDGGDSIAKILMLHIAVYGPKLRADAERLARAEHADLIVCGHSHVPFAARTKGLTVFNPGSIGPRRFSLPIVFGVIDLAKDRISVRHVNCETGETWLPPAIYS
jgi:putative phosphoesterase